MATLHVIGIEREVLMRWKAKAYEGGRNFREWVIETLNRAGDPRFSLTHEASVQGRSWPVSQAALVQQEAIKTNETAELKALEKSKIIRKSNEEILLEAQARLEERKKSIPPMRPQHDVKTCRLYGCLQCKATGLSDPIRGI